MNSSNQTIAAGAVAEYNQCPVIALVVPCYNEEEALPVTAPTLIGVLDRMVEEGIASGESFVLCVDDGSKDHTWSIIEKLHERYPRLLAISLAHNRGQQNAMLAGLMTVRPICDAAITLDADLQDSPDAIIEMVKEYRNGADIVYGVRSSRKSDSWFKRNSARAFYKLQRRLGLETIYDHSEFRLMDRRALDCLSEYGESNIFLRGIMPHIGLNSAIVRYDRSARNAGETKYSVGKLISISIDGITSFTAQPMRLIFMVGVALLLLDVFIGIWVLVSLFLGKAISGWASIMLSIWFLGSLMLIALGIIGEYIGKIFVEVKNRPRYAIAKEILK
ncbi:MAG: glycosyltransferase family 2 protein [Bacteroidales bacterium]|nr:glycosyltransferase family 2 protein [Bacteroidales bacterium]